MGCWEDLAYSEGHRINPQGMNLMLPFKDWVGSAWPLGGPCTYLGIEEVFQNCSQWWSTFFKYEYSGLSRWPPPDQVLPHDFSAHIVFVCGHLATRSAEGTGWKLVTETAYVSGGLIFLILMVVSKRVVAAVVDRKKCVQILARSLRSYDWLKNLVTLTSSARFEDENNFLSLEFWGLIIGIVVVSFTVGISVRGEIGTWFWKWLLNPQEEVPRRHTSKLSRETKAENCKRGFDYALICFTRVRW